MQHQHAWGGGVAYVLWLLASHAPIGKAPARDRRWDPGKGPGGGGVEGRKPRSCRVAASAQAQPEITSRPSASPASRTPHRLLLLAASSASTRTARPGNLPRRPAPPLPSLLSSHWLTLRDTAQKRREGNRLGFRLAPLAADQRIYFASPPPAIGCSCC